MNGNEVIKKINHHYKVCIPYTKRDYFSYAAEDHVFPIGVRVWVPFGKKVRLGIVIGQATYLPNSISLKPIIEEIDNKPLLSVSLLEIYHWVSRYYQIPLSEVIPLALPKNYRLGKAQSLPTEDHYQLALPYERALKQITKRALKQLAVLDYLKQFDKPVSKGLILQQNFSSEQLTKLTELGVLNVSKRIRLPNYGNGQINNPLALNPEQKKAVDCIGLGLNRYQCFLLQGVTGSGKTEVYLQVIAQVLSNEKQVLILVPEIGLTPQLLKRFAARFNQPLAVIHSHLNETERQTAWQGAKENLIKLIIGTRAAIFTPLPNIGLIVIDEEHDSSFKQAEGARYSARDTALMRAYLANIPIILGSATPSLESLHNCQQSKYHPLHLRHKALTETALFYQLIDMRNAPLQEGIAETTLKCIEQHLEQEKQVLIFINRRGYAPVLLCHHCGWMADCPVCDSHQTLHRTTHRLTCHHCGLVRSIPSCCEHCHSSDLVAIGAGTQRIFDYLHNKFPNVAMLRIDRDTARRKKILDAQLAQVSAGKVQLIVGTQMLAKGHHFPNLTLVVILEADAGFYNQDFRAIERLGQLFLQVAGRAGRAQHAGHVLIQTHIPQHPLLNLLIQEGYDKFAQTLLQQRLEAKLPPYHFLALIRAQDKQQHKVITFLHEIKQYLLQRQSNVLGPAPAPLARKAGQHRMQLLINSSSRRKLHTCLTELRDWLEQTKQTNIVRWSIDVDPIELS